MVRGSFAMNFFFQVSHCEEAPDKCQLLTPWSFPTSPQRPLASPENCSCGPMDFWNGMGWRGWRGVEFAKNGGLSLSLSFSTFNWWRSSVDSALYTGNGSNPQKCNHTEVPLKSMCFASRCVGRVPRGEANAASAGSMCFSPSLALLNGATRGAGSVARRCTGVRRPHWGHDDVTPSQAHCELSIALSVSRECRCMNMVFLCSPLTWPWLWTKSQETLWKIVHPTVAWA